MKLRVLVPLGALAIPLALLSPLAAGGSDWKKDFEEKWSSRNSWDRYEAVRKLDPANKDQLKILLNVAQKEDWYLRDACVGAIASCTDAKALAELRKDLKTVPPLAAEVIITAFGMAKDMQALDEIVEAFEKTKDQKDWQVRRACAIALGELPDKKGVGSLIKALDKEAKVFGVLIHVIPSLEKATHEKNNRTAQDWKNWWSGAEPSWAPGAAEAAEAAAKTQEEEDAKAGRIRTVCRGTNLDLKSRGKGTPLLILPEYGYEKDYLEEYLRPLEESNQLLYLNLPGVKDFTPALVPAAGMPFPEYPLDRLVDSLEDLRVQLIKDGKLEDKPYAILGHGLTAWVAIRYAWKHPKGIRRLAICSTYPSQRANGRDIQRMEGEGRSRSDLELEHLAGSMQFIGNGRFKYMCSSIEEVHALNRKGFSTYFANWQDLAIPRLLGPLVTKPGADNPVYRCQRPVGGCFIPKFDIGTEQAINTPTLIMVGDSENCFFGTGLDGEEITKAYPKSKLEVFHGCSRMLFMEDGKRFIESMEKFLQ